MLARVENHMCYTNRRMLMTYLMISESGEECWWAISKWRGIADKFFQHGFPDARRKADEKCRIVILTQVI